MLHCNISAPDQMTCIVFYEAKQSSGEEEGVTLVHQIRLKRGQFEATYKGAEEKAGKKRWK